MISGRNELLAMRKLSAWNDWHWQIANRLTQQDAVDSFPMLITPYYASLIRSWTAEDPIYCLAVPQDLEEKGSCQDEDPLGEDNSSPVPRLIRRYVDRAVVLATSMCAVHCRHCDRRRLTRGRQRVISKDELNDIITYLKRHREIRDVIISGGDPLTLGTGQLDRIISAIRGAGSVEIIRIGTRVPVTLPMRITGELCEMLRRHHPLYINTHFNHPREITDAAASACGLLADAGIPIGNQSVLLRGVNDSADTLEELFRGLLRVRVKPYYLFQCEPVPGIEHLRVPIVRGMQIMDKLRERAGGMVIPSYVLDTEDKGGKIPLSPDRVLSTDGEILLKTNDGRVISHPQVHGSE